MKILVTGFDPFGGETVNPSIEAVRLLPDEIRGSRIIKLQLPTAYGRSARLLKETIDAERPDVIISVGQAGGRKRITIERFAVNIQSNRLPDNDGSICYDEPICPEGPPAYQSGLPVKVMMQAVRNRGIPCEISYHAGTFVCNYIFYVTSRYCDLNHPEITNGFIHIPYLPQQVMGREDVPSMKLEDITAALQAAIEAVIDEKEKQS